MNLPQAPHPKPSHELDYPTVWIMILGLIIAIGPLSIDMYLPALPSMAQDFGVATAFMSNSVPAYFVGFGGRAVVLWSDFGSNWAHQALVCGHGTVCDCFGDVRHHHQ